MTSHSFLSNSRRRIITTCMPFRNSWLELLTLFLAPKWLPLITSINKMEYVTMPVIQILAMWCSKPVIFTNKINLNNGQCCLLPGWLVVKSPNGSQKSLIVDSAYLKRMTILWPEKVQYTHNQVGLGFVCDELTIKLWSKWTNWGHSWGKFSHWSISDL